MRAQPGNPLCLEHLGSSLPHFATSSSRASRRHDAASCLAARSWPPFHSLLYSLLRSPFPSLPFASSSTTSLLTKSACSVYALKWVSACVPACRCARVGSSRHRTSGAGIVLSSAQECQIRREILMGLTRIGLERRVAPRAAGGRVEMDGGGPRKEERKDGKEDVFEITDFTCATSTESFVSRIEERLRAWGLAGRSTAVSPGPPPPQPPSGPKRYPCECEVLDENNDPVILCFNFSGASVGAAARRAASRGWAGKEVFAEMSPRRVIGVRGASRICMPPTIAPPGFELVTRSHGLDTWLSIRPCTAHQTSHSRMRHLLSALCLACDACNCLVPRFCTCPVASSHIGQLPGHAPIRFAAQRQRLSATPRSLRHLSGLSARFAASLTERKRYSSGRSGTTGSRQRRVYVHAAFTCARSSSEWDWDDDEEPHGECMWRPDYNVHVDQDGDDDGVNTAFAAPWGHIRDPLSTMRLRASWPPFPEGSFSDDGLHSELEAANAPLWEVQVRWRDGADGSFNNNSGSGTVGKRRKRGLPGITRTLQCLFEAYAYGSAEKSIAALIAAPMGAPGEPTAMALIEGVWRVHAVGYAIRLRRASRGNELSVEGENLVETGAWPGTIRGSLSPDGRTLRFVQTSTARGGPPGTRPYSAECTCTVAPACAGRSARLVGGTWKDTLGRSGRFWCARDEISMPPPVLSLRNQRNAESKQGSDRDIKTSGSVDGANGPVPVRSLLSRLSNKLEARASTDPAAFHADGARAAARVWARFVREVRCSVEQQTPLRGISLEDPPNARYCVIHQKLRRISRCIIAMQRPAAESDSSDSSDEGKSSGGEIDARGAIGWVKELQLSNGNRMNNPRLLSGLSLTSDEAKAQSTMLSRLDGEAQRSVAARLASPEIRSNMLAFRAANPGCALKDFDRWNKWRIARAPSPAKHEPAALISRGDIERIWASTLREHPKGRPAVDQKPLFDAAMEAEKVLDYLETVDPRQLFATLASVALQNACVALEASEGAHAAAASPPPRQLSVASTKRGLNNPRSVDELRRALQRICQMEMACARAASLHFCFPASPKLVASLAERGRATVATADRAEVARFFAEAKHLAVARGSSDEQVRPRRPGDRGGGGSGRGSAASGGSIARLRADREFRLSCVVKSGAVMQLYAETRAAQDAVTFAVAEPLEL